MAPDPEGREGWSVNKRHRLVMSAVLGLVLAVVFLSRTGPAPETSDNQPTGPLDVAPSANTPAAVEEPGLEAMCVRLRAFPRWKLDTIEPAQELAFFEAKERALKVVGADAEEAERVAAHEYLMLFDVLFQTKKRGLVELESWLKDMARGIPAESAAELGRQYVTLNWSIYDPDDLTEAIERLDILIALFPDTSAGERAMCLAAKGCQRLGKTGWQSARDRFSRALEAIEDPELRRECFEERARANSHLSAWLDAAEDYSALIEEFPEDHDVLEWRLKRAEYFHYAGKTEQAVEELRALVKGPRGSVRGEALRLLAKLTGASGNGE